MKLHLGATPKNEGARRLGRTIMSAYRGNVFAAAKSMRVAPGTLMRLVDGAIIPGEELAGDIGRATGGPGKGIERLDWQREARGGWFDPVDAGVQAAGNAARRVAA
ncbi:MAG: hypothetical protein OSB00_07765 [Sphingomonas bacterium]|nr:hypothetical protein [Sphingomonas bacterium]